jgi:parvulin-like peptidyl-prolyl isomerase
MSPAPATQTVPETAPVITIEGVCDISLNGTAKPAATAHASASRGASAKPATAQSPSSCKTQITRAEFEKLLKTVAPNAPANVNRQIATRYVQLLTAANEGMKLGINKEPEYEEQLAIARLQVLAQTAERKLQSEAANVSEADEKAYYDQNAPAFEEVTLTRVFIPRSPGTATGNSQESSQAPASDPQTIADAARKDLASGADPEKVEKTAYEQLKNTTTPPSTKFGSRRRGSLPPAQEAKVFALNPGDVSEVFSDSIGFTIYKLDAKKQMPFDQVKDDIKRRLTQQHLEDSKQRITGASKADYNAAYFGPETAAANPAPPRVPNAPGNGAASSNPPTSTQSTATPK